MKYKKRENLKKLYMLLEDNHKEQNNFLNKEYLAEKLDVDIRTLERYINIFITKYNIKIQSQYKKGYFLTEKYTGRPPWQDELYDDEVILALILAERISTAIPDKTIKKTIKKTISDLYKSINWDPGELEGKISLKNTKYSKPDSKIFIEIVNSLKLSYKIDIEYQAINKKEKSNRIICPLHLLLYSGNWQLIAFCEERQGLRFFNLSRISKINLLNDNSYNWKKLNSIYRVKERINESYGIFVSNKKQEVELRFNKKIKGLIENLIWTPDQKIIIKEEYIGIKFFVSDYREIKNDILSYAENVEVIKPKELRDEVRASIANMQYIYNS